eukprot:jgi/Undpi1/6071/HiC_scaffold_20.g08556.m1
MPRFQRLCLPVAGVLAVFASGAAGFAVPAAKFAVYSSSSGGEAAAAPVESSVEGGDGQHEDVLQALIFDCDGVLADTERDGHRPAFNAAFKIKNLDCEWSVEQYGKLLSVGGGKERMAAHWDAVGWPACASTPEERSMLVKELHLLKTALFNQAVVDGEIPLRDGVIRLVDEAIFKKIPLAVCSTSNDKAVTNLVKTLMGKDRLDRIKIFAGDIVERKKPNPDIYDLAKDTMGLDPARVVVIEDSHIGLTAAKAAGMNCLVTKSSYTGEEDFSAADQVTEDLVEDGEASAAVTLATLTAIVKDRAGVAS